MFSQASVGRSAHGVGGGWVCQGWMRVYQGWCWVYQMCGYSRTGGYARSGVGIPGSVGIPWGGYTRQWVYQEGWVYQGWVYQRGGVGIPEGIPGRYTHLPGIHTYQGRVCIPGGGYT